MPTRKNPSLSQARLYQVSTLGNLNEYKEISPLTVAEGTAYPGMETVYGTSQVGRSPSRQYSALTRGWREEKARHRFPRRVLFVRVLSLLAPTSRVAGAPVRSCLRK